MQKKLSKSGNSYAVVLDKALLEAANIDADTPLEVSTNGDVILIQPVRSKRRDAAFRKAADEVMQKYAGVFARLAK